jgi:hypothetical protein
MKESGELTGSYIRNSSTEQKDKGLKRFTGAVSSQKNLIHALSDSSPRFEGTNGLRGSVRKIFT